MEKRKTIIQFVDGERIETNLTRKTFYLVFRENCCSSVQFVSFRDALTNYKYQCAINDPDGMILERADFWMEEDGSFYDVVDDASQYLYRNGKRNY